MNRPTKHHGLPGKSLAVLLALALLAGCQRGGEPAPVVSTEAPASTPPMDMDAGLAAESGELLAEEVPPEAVPGPAEGGLVDDTAPITGAGDGEAAPDLLDASPVAEPAAAPDLAAAEPPAEAPVEMPAPERVPPQATPPVPVATPPEPQETAPRVVEPEPVVTSEPEPTPEPLAVVPAPTPQVEPAPAQPAPDPVTPPPPSLDLSTLENSLRKTKAIGVFTKLELKNEVDDLIKEVDRYHHSKGKLSLQQLEERFDLLVMKLLLLLQDGDPQLHSAIASARPALWTTLADPNQFANLKGT